MDKDLVINQLLWVIAKRTGANFPFYDIVREGGVSEADARTLRTAFEAYTKTRTAAPKTTILPDKSASIHGTVSKGRTGRGGGISGADKASSIKATREDGR